MNNNLSGNSKFLVKYIDLLDKLVIESKDDSNKIYEAEVYVNHEQKEVRIFNLPKEFTTDYYLSQIIFMLLEKTVFYPCCKFSHISADGDISEYTLLVNGYLINGEYKEPGKKYHNMVTNFIDDLTPDIDDPDPVKGYREAIKHSYRSFSKDFGEAKVTIIFKGRSNKKQCLDFCTTLKAYMLDKGKDLNNVIKIERSLFQTVAYI